MKGRYFAKVTKLLEQARPRFASTHKLEFKNVFGAVGGYVNGSIFISCGKFSIVLRLPPKTLESVFKERGVKHLKYFSKDHIKKEYAVLPKRIVDNKDQFKRLLNESVRYASAS